MKMNRINALLTLSSLSVILVTIERFSFTTKVILQPYSFLRLHEVIQMTVLILITVIIPFLLLKELSANFELLKTKAGSFLGLIFITGVYFYATGNGAHEIASFTFNTYCDTKHISGDLCGGLFFNDYYFGNILYFVGAYLMNVVFLLLEQLRPNTTFSRKDYRLLVINSLIYSFAVFAYAAFDRVLVGLIYSLIMSVTIFVFFFKGKEKYLQRPITNSLALTYIIGTLASLFVRFH